MAVRGKKIKVRRLRKNEYKKILPLVRRIHPTELSDKVLAQWYTRSGDYPFVQWYVAELDNKIIGVTSWYLYDINGSEIIFMLSFTAIQKGSEGKSFSTDLVKKSYQIVSNYWKKHGLRVSAIWVSTEEKNYRARRFYKNVMSLLGFDVKEHPVKNMWGDEAVIFITGVKK